MNFTWNSISVPAWTSTGTASGVGKNQQQTCHEVIMKHKAMMAKQFHNITNLNHGMVMQKMVVKRLTYEQVHRIINVEARWW